MKKLSFKNHIALLLLGLMCVFATSCERGYSDDIDVATFPVSPDIFTDNPVGLTDEFFESFDPATGANTEGFGTDDNVAFKGTTSIRIDVPTPSDPNGGYIGGIFRDRGDGRDLSGYDALTFWMKGSTTALVGTLGFGSDFEENKYAVSINDVELSTDWRKIIIPIPDPSKLTQERGMFIFSAGSQSTNGVGYTIWIDEMRWENLGTVAQPRPAILAGQDQTAQANVGVEVPLGGLTQTFNLGNGQDITVNATPAYFDFVTSNPFVASVNDLGLVSVDGPGEINSETGLLENTATITASIAGVEAAGSLTIEASDLNIIALFSDIYAEVPVDNYNGFYAEFQTTQGFNVDEGGNEIIDYTELNFVAIEFYGREGSGVQPIDASEMTHLHIDVRVNESLDPADFLTFELWNNFTLGNAVSGGFTISSGELATDQWVEFDIPLTSFNGLTATDALGALFTVSNATISAVSLDNIYFYSEN
ncbi:CIA30 family protein [Winogradskyella sp.]